jgi:hypothetical protein
MLGTAAVVVRGQASAASTYTGRVTGYSPDWYLPLAESVGTTATALIGPNGTYQNNPQLGVDSIAQDDPGGRSVGLSAATTDTPHITATSPLAGPNLTIDLIVQLDDLTKAKHVLINSVSLTAGSSSQPPKPRAMIRSASFSFAFWNSTALTQAR